MYIAAMFHTACQGRYYIVHCLLYFHSKDALRLDSCHIVMVSFHSFSGLFLVKSLVGLYFDAPAGCCATQRFLDYSNHSWYQHMKSQHISKASHSIRSHNICARENA